MEEEMAKRSIRWSSVAEYVESGRLVATVMEDGTPTESTFTIVLTDHYSGWKKMSPSERYQSGNGVKQIAGDSAAKDKGSATSKLATMADTVADLLAGVMPGTGSRVSLLVRAIARFHGVDESVALKAYDSWGDAKKAEVAGLRKIKSHVADIRQERLDAERAALESVADEDETEVVFEL
jgi:hypothetical protein